MDKNKLIAYLKEKQVEKVKFAFADIDGVLRGKMISTQKLLEGLTDGIGFCDVVFGWDMADALIDTVTFTGWHTGFPDRPCFIDPATLREIPWQDNLPFFLADFSGNNAGHQEVCPRSLLKRIVADCTSLGYHPEFAQEFEWFNFSETPASLQEKEFNNLEPVTPGMFGYSILRGSQNPFYKAIFNSLPAFGIPLEGLHTETGPGVYEAAILHDHALTAADKAALFKNAIKEIASLHGITASFMAKWNPSLPGCSGHLHQSLWNPGQTKNLFYDPGMPDKMSTLFRHYLAGQLHCLPYLLPMYGPTLNSYKRLVEGAWAPTTISWGIENRTTALRVINTNEGRMRLETRVPGSDSNPYLAISAALASGLYGIKHQLPLNLEAVKGNAYRLPLAGKLPVNLLEATENMIASGLPGELFGEVFTRHFTATRLWECSRFDSSVENWELKRYFEII